MIRPRYFVKIDGKAVPKERARVTRWSTRTPKRTLAYQERVAAAARDEGVTLMTGVCLDVLWHRGRTKKDDRPPVNPGDIDNVLKVLMDGLQGVAYEADAAVNEATIRRISVPFGKDWVGITIWGENAIRDD